MTDQPPQSVTISHRQPGPVRGFDRMLLAQIADRYGIEAVRRALDDYEAGKRARADG
jgi:hypothetical protein